MFKSTTQPKVSVMLVGLLYLCNVILAHFYHGSMISSMYAIFNLFNLGSVVYVSRCKNNLMKAHTNKMNKKRKQEVSAGTGYTDNLCRNYMYSILVSKLNQFAAISITCYNQLLILFHIGT